jgi:glycine/D-amino acid oxidase-like deaminating enzyme
VEYKGHWAQRIIFCEGQYTQQNPYWNHLPFNPAKGEILTIRAENLPTDAIVSKGIFVLPLGNHTYKIGSTYYWDDKEEQPTERGRSELTQKLEEVITVPYEVIDHKAALRPTVTDRRPLIGLHPQYPSIGIFNGLGTRGVLLAPYFARHFMQHLLDGEELNSEVNVGRFD